VYTDNRVILYITQMGGFMVGFTPRNRT